MQLADPKQILRSAKSILLVDWASRDVPLSLGQAGFEVFCASPGRYSVVELGEDNCVFFHQLEKNPAHVDIVNVFRPENEHEEIVARYVIPLEAKVLCCKLRSVPTPRGGWVSKPASSWVKASI